MADKPRCSVCGAELPPGAPGGHCPKCLLGFAEHESPEEAILTAALKFPIEHRESYLQSACAENEQLRAQVEALLQAVGESADLIPEQARPASTSQRSIPLLEKPGDKIGRYRLLQHIGEGGCGAVYMAEQEESVRRRVALKVIKLGMDTKAVIARFEAERQALALMDHPNIAKVLDAGATETGRPYFVMELVRGIKITDYCDHNSLSTRERLELFVQVCHAIQHAHQKGIIHRDIKPSNILVTVNDGVAVPKVIDFGIAKATQGRLTDHTLFTAFEQFLGTPAYMSPEQAEMTSLDVDTRSDIYSLGVLLYELLTSRTPFDANELLRTGLDEIRRTIREQEPERPSTRLSTMLGADLTLIAQQRKSEPPKLIHLLRGDLDWIVMKALEKNRARRYETANGVALDLQRHMNHEPVLARPPSQLYRVQKLIQRNKLACAAAASVVLALVLGAVVSAWQAERAIHAEALATQRLAESEAVSKFLLQVFPHPDPNRDGRTITVAEILFAAAGKLETDLSSHPALRAKLQANLGATYEALALYHDAIPLQEKVRDFYLTNSGPEDIDTLAAMQSLALSYDDVGRREESRKLREMILALRRKVLGPENPDTLAAMQDLATSYSECGRRDEALDLRKEGLTLRRKVLGLEHPATLTAMQNLAMSHSECGHPDEASKLVEEVLILRRKMFNLEHPDALTAMNHGPAFSDAAGPRNEALKLEEEGLALRRKVLGSDHPNTLAAMSKLAISYFELGQRQAGLKLQEDVLALRRKALGPEHPDTLAAMQNLATSYAGVDRQTEALKLREEVVTLRRKVLGPENLDTLEAMQNLAVSYYDFDRRDEALHLMEEGLRLRRKTLGPENPDTLAAMQNLAKCYSEFGRPDQEMKLREEELALRRNTLGPENPDTLTAMNDLSVSYLEAGRREEAIKLREDVLTFRRRRLGPDHPDTHTAMLNLAISYDDFGRRDEALKLEEDVLALRHKVLGPEHLATLEAMNVLARTLVEGDSADIRNRTNAVRLAEEAVAMTRRTNACFLETLATAYSKTSQFGKAVPVQEAAAALAKIGNPSFETPFVGPTNDYFSGQYHPPGAAWTFHGHAGIAANGGGFACYNAGTSNGNQFAYLQGLAGMGGSMSQTMTNFAQGLYTFAFIASQRDKVGRDNTENQTVTVLVDGMKIGSFVPADTNWYSFQTTPVSLGSGNHVLTMASLPVAGDATVRLDKVSVTGSYSP